MTSIVNKGRASCPDLYWTSTEQVTEILYMGKGEVAEGVACQEQGVGDLTPVHLPHELLMEN